jgi:AraC family transcriptional regulator of adaptative response/methylated-DNA-[protein]-cysteine methyltransferase
MNHATEHGMSGEEMWAAFAAKDAAFDGRFYVAVRTTGVYCRPSCRARPQRRNVEFFADAAAAEAAGYRPCKRCRPRDAHAPAAALAQRVADFVEAHGHARLDALSRELNYSPAYLQRTFKRVLGVSPAQYARARNAAPERRGPIRCSVFESPLGRMLVACTAHGLCAVYFGDDEAALVRELRRVHPRAPIERDDNDETLASFADALRDCLAGRTQHGALRSLPLDVQGTAFQAQVWQALRTIPDGETRTYAQIAAAIGRPTAARAVANACGANEIAVVIPCHRAVRSDGAAGGYRWGAERKKWLVETKVDSR